MHKHSKPLLFLNFIFIAVVFRSLKDEWSLRMTTLCGNDWMRRFNSRLSLTLFLVPINYLTHLCLQLHFSFALASSSSDMLPHLLQCLAAQRVP